MGVTHFDGLDAVSSFALGGTTVTLTAAEMNGIHNAGLASIVSGGNQLFLASSHLMATVNAGSGIVVPAVAGKQFFPVWAALQAVGGNAGTCTLIRLMEDAGGVVLSHARADVVTTAWAGPTGGTVVTTLLGTALTAGKGILIDKTGGNLDTATSVKAVVAGYYI